VTATLDFEGPIQMLLDERPRLGTSVFGFGFGLLVTLVEIEEGDADTGKMVVTLESQTAPEQNTSFAAIGEPIYELDMGELIRPIETHPKCGVLKPNRPTGSGSRKKTWDDWADLKPGVVYEFELPNWSLAQYQSLREKGVESYPVAAPVVRRTLTYLRDPGGIGAGLFSKQNPPVGAPQPDPPPIGIAWKWLLTADKLTKEGRNRTRVTEWTGAYELEELLYE
jgi:hypothetical protein